MPTFSTVVLETLIQPKPKNLSTTPPPLLKLQPPPPQIHHLGSSKDETRKEQDQQQRRQRQQKRVLNPALYATPQPTPILDSSTALSGSVSPSPYVFNRKGRGGRDRNTTSPVNRKIDGFEIDQQRRTDFASEENDVEAVDVNFAGDEICVKEEEEDGDFLDPRGGGDSSCVASSSDFGSGRRVDILSLVSNQGEFFDADEDFSGDGSISSVLTCSRSIELELRATRLSLFEEIEKQTNAENALGMMQSLWQRVASLLLSQTGLTFPVPSNSTAVQLDMSSLVQLSQEVIVARFVYEAIGKGEARAEAELAAEVIIDGKDREISRLRDRLQYYKAMNREMSQRNIEVMEVARRQRTRKRGQRRWLWSCLGISVVIGASVIAYSCLPQTSEHHMLAASSCDSSCISSLESS